MDHASRGDCGGSGSDREESAAVGAGASDPPDAGDAADADDAVFPAAFGGADAAASMAEPEADNGELAVTQLEAMFPDYDTEARPEASQLRGIEARPRGSPRSLRCWNLSYRIYTLSPRSVYSHYYD